MNKLSRMYRSINRLTRNVEIAYPAGTLLSVSEIPPYVGLNWGLVYLLQLEDISRFITTWPHTSAIAYEILYAVATSINTTRYGKVFAESGNAHTVDILEPTIPSVVYHTDENRLSATVVCNQLDMAEIFPTLFNAFSLHTRALANVLGLREAVVTVYTATAFYKYRPSKVRDDILFRLPKLDDLHSYHKFAIDMLLSIQEPTDYYKLLEVHDAGRWTSHTN